IDDYRVTRGRDFQPGARREDGMPNDHGEGNETAPPVTSQPIPGPQEPETGSREPATESAPRRRRFVTGALKVLVAVVVVWLLSAYVILPALWRHYEHQPCCKNAPKTTRTNTVRLKICTAGLSVSIIEQVCCQSGQRIATSIGSRGEQYEWNYGRFGRTDAKNHYSRAQQNTATGSRANRTVPRSRRQSIRLSSRGRWPPAS